MKVNEQAFKNWVDDNYVGILNYWEDNETGYTLPGFVRECYSEVWDEWVEFEKYRV